MFQTLNRLADMSGPVEVGRRESRRVLSGTGHVRRTDSPGYAPLSVHQDDQHARLEFDVPGLHAEDLDLTLANGYLRIRGRRNRPQRDAACSYDDRHYGDFERTVRLDETIESDSIDAKLEAGVLSVRFSKKRQAQPQHVDVKYGSGAS